MLLYYMAIEVTLMTNYALTRSVSAAANIYGVSCGSGHAQAVIYT